MFVVELAARRNVTVTRTVKATFVSVFAGLLLALLEFHDHAPPCKRSPFELWLSATVSVNVQITPVDTVTTGAHTFMVINPLHWSIWQALLLLFRVCIGAVWQNKKILEKKSYKQMIVMFNLVLIDVICIVCFTVYGSTCVMWDCTYILCIVEF